MNQWAALDVVNINAYVADRTKNQIYEELRITALKLTIYIFSFYAILYVLCVVR